MNHYRSSLFHLGMLPKVTHNGQEIEICVMVISLGSFVLNTAVSFPDNYVRLGAHKSQFVSQ